MNAGGEKRSIPRVFCENSSIRGLGKLAKHRQPYVRIVWIFFLVTMTGLLAYGTITLIMEFLMYKTTILTKETFDKVPLFPSVTFCNHHPFSSEGMRLWKNGKVSSPAAFNRRLRRFINQTLSEGSIDDARRLFYSDKLSTYYESIGPNVAVNIGHPRDSMVYCVLLTKNNVSVGHASECGIDLQLLRHPQYFNCYTATVQEKFSKETIALGLIIHLGKKPAFTGMKMGFMHDVLNQAHGLRVVMHPVGTLADLKSDGYNVEAGKYAELRFESEFWRQKDRPTERCTDPLYLPKIQHDDVTYRYTEHACNMRETSHKLLEKCGCVSTEYITERFSNPSPYRYCSNFTGSNFREFLTKFECVKKILSDLQSRKNWQNCAKPCEFYRYEAHLSTSKWVPSPWQLQWLMQLSDTWIDLRSDNDTLKKIARQTLARFLTAEDLSNETSSLRGQSDFSNEDEHIFVVVTRRTFAAMHKDEVLSLTIYALLSRIGGLSSLSLGVTVATIFEIVEFCCLMCQRSENRQDDRLPKLRNRASPSDRQKSEMNSQFTTVFEENNNDTNNTEFRLL